MEMTQFQKSKQSQNNNVDQSKDYVCVKNIRSQKKKIEMQGKNTGHWSVAQKLQYLQFLKSHQINFVKKQLRRTDKIFKEMAKFIHTRIADQCRSHHQKMQKKYGSYNAILDVLNNDYYVKVALQTLKFPQFQETKVQTPIYNSSSFDIDTDKLFLGQNQQNNFLSMSINIQENDIDFNNSYCSLFSMDDPIENIFQQNGF